MNVKSTAPGSVFKDKSPELKGHWKLDIYEGDIKWSKLTLKQKLNNKFWDLEALLPSKFRDSKQPRRIKDGIKYYVPVRLNTLLDTLEGDNLVTTSGKGIILDRLYNMPGSPTGAVTKMGVGTSSTAAAVGDTSLTGVNYSAAAAFDALPTRSGLVATSIQTFLTTDANFAWAELGEFNAANTMLNRIAPIGPFTKSSAVSIVVTVQLTQS